MQQDMNELVIVTESSAYTLSEMSSEGITTSLIAVGITRRQALKYMFGRVREATEDELIVTVDKNSAHWQDHANGIKLTIELHPVDAEYINKINKLWTR